jgi:hypothetical protein
VSRNRARTDNRSEQKTTSSKRVPPLPGLRWVPVPLAMLMAALGWLVFGSVLGQHALASAHAGLHAGGLGLTVNQVVWMADDMTDPGTKVNPSQFHMPSDMMPGMQTAGEKRLRIELYIRNISNSPQRYGLAEFRLFGTGGRSWAPVDNTATRGAVLSAVLDPGFQTTFDLYFDLPNSQGNRLSLEWENGGTTVKFPVHVIGGLMVGM